MPLMMDASRVAQLMMGSIGGRDHYMSNIVYRPNPLLLGGVTPTKDLIEDRIRGILDPLDSQALQADGSEFAAGSTIHIEAAAEQVLDIQEAIDAKVASENESHDDSGRTGYGVDLSLPCKLVDHTPSRTR